LIAAFSAFTDFSSDSTELFSSLKNVTVNYKIPILSLFTIPDI
jgi:hypothetical protein